jgi:hypothetical protein
VRCYGKEEERCDIVGVEQGGGRKEGGSEAQKGSAGGEVGAGSRREVAMGCGTLYTLASFIMNTVVHPPVRIWLISLICEI